MNLDLSTAKLSIFVLMPFIALLFEGVKRKAFARMQHRIGPPIYQPFLDIIKLFAKGKSDSLGSENLFFRICPYLAFIVSWGLFLFVPLSLISFDYDFILLVYLVVLSGGLSILAGLSSNNPYAIISSMRDLILMICYEIIFAIIIITFMVYNNIINFANYNGLYLFYKLPLALIAFIYITIAVIKITPLDTVSANTEVLEGEETEFSGKGLAFFLLSDYTKNLFFASLLVYLFIGNINLLALFAITLFIAIVFAFIRASTCRYKVEQAFKVLTIVLLIAMIEFVRIKLNFIW